MKREVPVAAEHIRSDGGFTIVELLAAMVISSLVVAMAYAMYSFAEKIMSNWEKRTELSSLVDQCSQTIAADVMSCSSLVECDDSSLVLEENHADTISYVFAAGSVSRNGVLFRTPSENAGDGPQETKGPLLGASVFTSVDTGTASGWPVRLWSIRVTGQATDITDSSAIHLSTPMSSEEIVRTDSSGATTE